MSKISETDTKAHALHGPKITKMGQQGRRKQIESGEGVVSGGRAKRDRIEGASIG